jgi:hypothetical protein
MLFKPTISVSSLRPDTNDWTIGPHGFAIILSGGKVLSCMPHDMGTLRINLKGKISLFDDIANNISAIKQSIDRPYKKPNMIYSYLKDGQHNELCIENPVVAGICLKWFSTLPLDNVTKIVTQDEMFMGSLIDHDSIWNIFKLVHSLKISLFVLTPNNHVKELRDINFAERSFRVSADFTPEMIVKAMSVESSPEIIS